MVATAAPLLLQHPQVPRNERGSVEVPPFVATMPQGCVHLPVRLRACTPVLRLFGAPLHVGASMRVHVGAHLHAQVCIGMCPYQPTHFLCL